MVRFLFFFLVQIPAILSAQEILLYPNGRVPLSVPCSRVEVVDSNKTDRPQRLRYIQSPRLRPYRTPKNSKAAILVIPGGGYGFVSIENEGRIMGEALQKAGFDAYVLIYRLPLPECQQEARWVPLTDAQNALVRIREMGYSRVGVLGFSAGGHLASCLATLANQNPHFPMAPVPDAVSLMYPVIDMKEYRHTGSRKSLLGVDSSDQSLWAFSTQTRVSATTPPCQLIHSLDDKAVPWQNSLLFAKALQEVGGAAELHLYPTGGHGFGMGTSRPGAPDWFSLFLTFMKKHLGV